jgi:hypothetical protein
LTGILIPSAGAIGDPAHVHLSFLTEDIAGAIDRLPLTQAGLHLSRREVNLQFLSDLEVYLFANGYSKDTVVTMMKKFRHIIEIALNKE